MTFFCGYYNGLDNISPFAVQAFDDISKVMLYVNSHLDWFYKMSYGFTIYTDQRIKEGNHYVQKTLMSWHRDGSDCKGEIVNRRIGWRMYIDSNNRVSENHFNPKEEH